MDNNTKYRSAIGVDFHPLTMNKKLTLGGIEIPYTKGLDGHSDGDALTHAIIDSIFLVNVLSFLLNNSILIHHNFYKLFHL